MTLTLQQLHIGKVDGKHEYLTPINERERSIFDAFLIPETVQPDRMHNGDIFLLRDFVARGKRRCYAGMLKGKEKLAPRRILSSSKLI